MLIARCAACVSAVTLGLVALVSGPLAHAGGYFELTGFPQYVDSTDGATGADGTIGGSTQGPITPLQGWNYQVYLTLGYTFFNGQFLIGGTFDYGNFTQNEAATSQNGSVRQEISEDQYGPTIGWVPGNFRILATYLFGGQRTFNYTSYDTSGNPTDEQSIQDLNLSGWQFTVGYTFPIASWFHVGPTLVYRYLKYKNQSDTSASFNYTNTPLVSPAIESGLSPMITLQFEF